MYELLSSTGDTGRAAKADLVEPSGIEPLTSCVQGRRSPS